MRPTRVHGRALACSPHVLLSGNTYKPSNSHRRATVVCATMPARNIPCSLEQPCRHRQQPQTENVPHVLGTQQMHGTRPELAVTARARRERKDGASFDVWAPWGCSASGSPRPRTAAQTAPQAVSAVSAGGDARLLRVRRVRSPSR
eukprot:3902916-Prymnesium_polylepis.3